MTQQHARVALHLHGDGATQRRGSTGLAACATALLMLVQHDVTGEEPAQPAAQTRVAVAKQASRQSRSEAAARQELAVAFERWVAATNARDLDEQIAFYPERVPVFYLWRDASRSAVRAEKKRVISDAEWIDIKAETPQIVFEPSGNQARMYFRKEYAIRSERGLREGEVLQELRWENGPNGWQIVGERDLRVLR